MYDNDDGFDATMKAIKELIDYNMQGGDDESL